MEAVKELERFSHIWIVFVFHQNTQEQWKTTVRPPRLGGNRRVGVFATRSGFRPNSIGMSAVALSGIRRKDETIWLDIQGIDLLDKTPVLDIKPYVPYADSIAAASAGFADLAPARTLQVEFTAQARAACRTLENQTGRPIMEVISQSLQYDPRPAYLDEHSKRQFGTVMFGAEIKWRVAGDRAVVYFIAAK